MIQVFQIVLSALLLTFSAWLSKKNPEVAISSHHFKSENQSWRFKFKPRHQSGVHHAKRLLVLTRLPSKFVDWSGRGIAGWRRILFRDSG